MAKDLTRHAFCTIMFLAFSLVVAAAGNETDWSSPVQEPIPLVAPGDPISRGSSLNTAYISIDPGQNAPTAEYAINVDGKYVSPDMPPVFYPVWRTLDEWGEIIAIMDIVRPPTTIQVTVLVPGAPGDPSVQEQSSIVRIEVTGAADTIPPQPDVMHFEAPFPTARGATWVAMTAIEAHDVDPNKTWVRYGFRSGVSPIEWSWTRTHTFYGLTPASIQIFYVIVRDAGYNTNNNGWSGPSFAYTLAAIPNAPVVTPHTSTIDLTIDTNGNPSLVKYAIYDSILDRYLAADRTLTSTVPVWQRISQWGYASTITGVQPGSTHMLQVKAKSPEGIETEFSPGVVVTLSGIARPGAPAVPAGLLGSVSLMLQLNGLGTWGPADTFLIRATAATSQYVQADGSLGAAEVWQTLNQWGSPVCIHSLSGNTVYTFDVRAKVGGYASEWGVPLENVLTNIPGDATGDDTVNILDMIYVRSNLNALRCSGEAFKGDVTDDGVVNVLDMIFIRNHLNDTR